MTHTTSHEPSWHRALTIGTLTLAATAFASQHAAAQVAGSTTVGVSVTELKLVAAGWSAKRQVLGQVVYNEGHEKVGRIDDLIVAPDSAVSFVIVGAGGFVGLQRHHVAVPAGQLVERNGSFVLPGATKAAIKALPAFDYAQ